MPFADERADWHVAVNPIGGIPALIDGDVVLAESNAILRYLAAREGRDDLLPADPRERAPVDWLLDTVGTTLRPICREVDGPAYGWRAHLGIGSAAPRPGDVPAAIASIAPRLETYSRARRRRRLRLSRPPDARRLLGDAVALAPPARGRARRACQAAQLGRDGRRAPGLGLRRRRERRAGVITSRANARVRAARALGEAKERKRTGLFLDEGEDALRSALAAGIAPVEAFVDDDLGSDRIADELGAMGATVQRCSREVMEALSSLSHASRAVGVFRANDLPPLAAAASQVGLQLHGVSDPGNLGTLLRSAQGFGPAHVALAEGCADPLSPRAVRASMGALYSVPVITLREAPALCR